MYHQLVGEYLMDVIKYSKKHMNPGTWEEMQTDCPKVSTSIL